jgi:hypothetical protein
MERPPLRSIPRTRPVYKYKGGPIGMGSSNPSMNLFNNLDESSQIGLCTMYAHNSIKILYEAKVNRAIFDYANKYKLTSCDNLGNCPTLVTARNNTRANLVAYGGICSATSMTTDGSGPIVSLPCGDATVAGDAGEGSIEVKAAWRALTPLEASSGHFFVRKVIFYTGTPFRQSGLPECGLGTGRPSHHPQDQVIPEFRVRQLGAGRKL